MAQAQSAKARKDNTLKMIECPDFVEKHIPDFCSCCGKDISSHSGEFVGRHLLIDIQEISYHLQKHKVYSRTCTCRHHTIAQYPIEANIPISNGNKLECLIGYLHARHYISIKCMEQLIEGVFNLPISESDIHNLLNKLVNKAGILIS
jgi:transposase